MSSQFDLWNLSDVMVVQQVPNTFGVIQENIKAVKNGHRTLADMQELYDDIMIKMFEPWEGPLGRPSIKLHGTICGALPWHYLADFLWLELHESAMCGFYPEPKAHPIEMTPYMLG